MAKQHWMISIVRILAILFVLFGCLLVFWYTPFYSNIAVKALETFVPIDVDVVAAQSQQMAALTDHEELEPGSKLWIARQAYLEVMQNAIQSENTQDLVVIQTRYKILIEEIKAFIASQKSQQAESEKSKNTIMNKMVEIPQLSTDVDQDNAQQLDKDSLSPTHDQATQEKNQQQSLEADSLQKLKEADENKALKVKYAEFLENHPIDQASIEAVDEQTFKDVALIQYQSAKKKAPSQPYAIVILGGGLTLGQNKIDIVVNDYTRLRLEKTLEVEKQTQLPIVLSGVEAPYMQAWLKNAGVEANLLENRSMNTCENTRFSSLLLQKKGGAPTVILVTDRYHMPRTRRLFALNGIETIPVEAPMPTKLTTWQPSQQNYDHSRRANYEILASLRDVLFGSSGCREVP